MILNHRSRQLRNHGINALAGRLQQLFHRDLHEQADAPDRTDPGIYRTGLHDLRVVRLHCKEHMGKYTADNCEYNRAYYQQKKIPFFAVRFARSKFFSPRLRDGTGH